MDIVLPEDPAIPLLGIHPEDAPTGKKDTCSTMFIAALFIIARNKNKYEFKFKYKAGKNPDAPQQSNGYRKCGSFIQ